MSKVIILPGNFVVNKALLMIFSLSLEVKFFIMSSGKTVVG
jgi:hypothetical protein